HQPSTTLFPYTTLFRSAARRPSLILAALPARSPTHAFSWCSARRSGRSTVPTSSRSPLPEPRVGERVQLRVVGPAHAQQPPPGRSEEHTSELQSLAYLV